MTAASESHPRAPETPIFDEALRDAYERRYGVRMPPIPRSAIRNAP
jgi:hypothetical protein